MKKLLLFVMVLVLSACSALPGSDLSSNRTKWENAGINAYTFQLHIGCFCVFTDRMPLTIEVRDGAVTSMTYSDGTPVAADDPLMEYFQRFATIDGLFDELQNGEAATADSVEVSYDATYGFPTQVYVDQIQEAADDEYSLQVSGLTPLQ